jgi:hypothetical protein
MEAMRQRMEDLERVVEDDAEVVRHGGKHEEQVVQELWEVPLGNRVFPLSFFVRYDEDVVWF